jgi:hypothetical protein
VNAIERGWLNITSRDLYYHYRLLTHGFDVHQLVSSTTPAVVVTKAYYTLEQHAELMEMLFDTTGDDKLNVS